MIKRMEDRRSEIWVCCEKRQSRLTAASSELIGKARELADSLGYSAAAVIFEDMSGESAAQTAIGLGADIVYRFCHSRFFRTEEDLQAWAIADLMESGRPWACLFPAETHGRLTSALLAARLKTGLTADCTGLSVEDGWLLQTRPAFGGSLIADILCRHSLPQMASVQSGVFPRPEPDADRQGVIIDCALPAAGPSALKLIGCSAERKAEESLSEAKVVLAGGMGLGSVRGFRALKRAADRIGAVPAASRAAVGAGLAPYSWQVGLSGKTIRPELYIACGISGAVQHMAGVRGAARVIAVNLDKKAPVFDCADVGIIADCLAFLEKLETDFGARPQGRM